MRWFTRAARLAASELSSSTPSVATIQSFGTSRVASTRKDTWSLGVVSCAAKAGTAASNANTSTPGRNITPPFARGG